MTSIITSHEYREAILTNLMDRDDITMGNGLRIVKMSDMEEEFSIRLIVPMSLGDTNVDFDSDVRDLAYRLITTMLSDTTDGDACDISIRERSGHFDRHDDLKDLPNDLSLIVIDATVNDYLS